MKIGRESAITGWALCLVGLVGCSGGDLPSNQGASTPAGQSVPPPPPPPPPREAVPVVAAQEQGPFEVGTTAPEISGEDIDGVPFQLSDYRGKVVVLDFWGDW